MPAPFRRVLVLLFLLPLGCGAATQPGQQTFYEFVKLDGPNLSMGKPLQGPPEQGSYATVWTKHGVPVRAVMRELDAAPVVILMRYGPEHWVHQTIVATVSASSPARVIRHGRAGLDEGETKSEKLITEFDESGRVVRTRYYVNGELISDKRE